MAKQKKRIAINGLGRIGRLALRIFLEQDDVEVVAFNDLADTSMLAHLLKYDTAQGGMTASVRATKSAIRVGKQSIKGFAERDPENLPWKELEIDIVVECTGFFRTKELASKHLKAGAAYVVISAPAGSEVDTVVMGVNDKLIKKGTKIYSNASCTTNCLAPMAKTLHEAYGIKSAIMNTIHAYTADQNIQDGIHKKDYRRARAAAQNMVPTTSGATSAVEMVYPALKGKMTGGAVRVPVITGSLTEFFCTVEKTPSVEEINLLFKTASKKQLKGILRYTEDPIVSSDIIHDPHSCIFDADLTTVMGDLVKIVGWYDNEYGYASRLTQMVTKLASLK